MEIRKYQTTDCDEIAQMFYNTVHFINKNDYSEEQLNVWATGNVDIAAWNDSFLKHYTVVAEINDKIIAFGDIDEDYLDRLYVHKDYQGQGIATAVLERLEQHAKENGEVKITTYASITAKPFFEKRGYAVIKEQ